ncbi:hypothetical protein H0H92_006227 [Tricholoma furcatifolium]|nr:hypothetical protein H0H92_006227 [Tricholoma furcatifolium]
MSSKATRRAQFESVFETIRDELVEGCKKEGLPTEALEWFRANLNYNVPGGKLNRGLSVIDTAEILKGRPLTADEYFQAAVLGWSVELLQAYFLVADDIMDSSITRRSQPCWYLATAPAVTAPSSESITSSTHKHPAVGMVAINDSFMLNSAIYHLLRAHFRSHPRYIDIVDLFHDITYKTEMGQLVDLVTAPEGVVDLARFSLERHRLIVTYKTAYYSFHLPVALAMLMCNIPETYTVQTPQSTRMLKPYDLALSILIPLGEYFQVQDDFLDFSAPPEILGKIGTDIVDNKCSWCVNTVMGLCTPEQRLILDRNYGRKGDIEAGAEGADTEQKPQSQHGEAGGLCEKRVKDLYEAVGLRKVYAEYEAGVYKRLNELIDSIPEDGVILDERGQKAEHQGMKREVFRSFLEKIYGRLRQNYNGTKAGVPYLLHAPYPFSPHISNRIHFTSETAEERSHIVKDCEAKVFTSTTKDSGDSIHSVLHSLEDPQEFREDTAHEKRETFITHLLDALHRELVPSGFSIEDVSMYRYAPDHLQDAPMELVITDDSTPQTCSYEPPPPSFIWNPYQSLVHSNPIHDASSIARALHKSGYEGSFYQPQTARYLARRIRTSGSRTTPASDWPDFTHLPDPDEYPYVAQLFISGRHGVQFSSPVSLTLPSAYILPRFSLLKQIYQEERAQKLLFNVWQKIQTLQLNGFTPTTVAIMVGDFVRASSLPPFHSFKADVQTPQPEYWKSQPLIVSDPFAITQNHAEGVSEDELKRFSDDCARALRIQTEREPVLTPHEDDAAFIEELAAEISFSRMSLDAYETLLRNSLALNTLLPPSAALGGSWPLTGSRVNLTDVPQVTDPAMRRGYEPGAKPKEKGLYAIRSLAYELKKDGFKITEVIPKAAVPIG